MTAQEIIKDLETLAVPDLESIAQALIPKLPVDSLVRFAEWIDAALTATTEKAQVTAAEQAIIAADDAVESEVATKP